MDNTLLEIENVIAGLYEALSFGEGENPKWDDIKKLFVPNARLLHASVNSNIELSVDEFISAYKSRISKGELKEFEEIEISHRTEYFGNIAHRFSSYRADPSRRGINSFQLVKEKNEWKIYSVVWFDETDSANIPKQYL